MKMENNNEAPGGDQAILEQLKENLFSRYKAESDPTKATIFMSTDEIFSAFQRIFPSKKYDAEMVATWLFENGFTLCEMGQLRFEWMLVSNIDIESKNL